MYTHTPAPDPRQTDIPPRKSESGGKNLPAGTEKARKIHNFLQNSLFPLIDSNILRLWFALKASSAVRDSLLPLLPLPAPALVRGFQPVRPQLKLLPHK